MAPIDEDGARRAGAAAAAWSRASRGGVVFVARDTRPSGAALAAAALSGAASAGAWAVDAGVLPSAGLSAAVAATPGATGVMVTASHNPVGDNGFKVLGPGGAKPDDAWTARLEAWLAAPPVADGGVVVDGKAQAGDAYTRAWIKAAGDLSPLRGRRIAIDLANGAASEWRALWSRALKGVDVCWLGAGDGVINDGCGSEHPESLAAAVRAQACDAGLAVDGDADRALLVDHTGAVVHGDRLTWLLTQGLGVRGLAVTVMSTLALESTLAGVRVVRTPVGDRHLSIAMREHGLDLGAEESGHVLFSHGLPGGDGMLTGLRALAAAFAAADSLQDAIAPFVPWPRKLTKVRAAARVPFESVAEIVEAIAVGEAALGQGRVFVRWSGTEPVLRVLVEAPDLDRVVHVSERVTEVCRRALGGES